MCNNENHSVAAEIKTERMDEYPEFPNISDFNPNSEIKQEPVDIKEEPVDPDEFSRPWETYNEPDPEPTERKIVFECRICIQRKNRFIKKFTSIIALTKHIHRHTEKKLGKSSMTTKNIARGDSVSVTGNLTGQ